MIKILTNSYDFNESAVKRISSPRTLEKTAAHEDVLKYMKNFKAIPGETQFHVLFLGSGEYYSSNRNGDWFGEDDLVRRHHTFVQFGHVYRHHQNKDPKKKYGDIKLSLYHKIMRRVEGMISVINSKNQDVLEKYEAGEDIPVSMAAKLKYDICSICGHRSKTFDEYCDHLKNQMNQILPDGRKVYAINPNPIFFDISLVWRPADPTAYFFSKVASEGFMAHSAYWGELMYDDDNLTIDKEALDKSALEKKSIIKKLADLEKHVEGIISGKIDNNGLEPLLNVPHNVVDFPHSVLCSMKKLPLDSVMSTLSNYNIMLKLKEFLELIDKPEMHDDVKSMLPGCFSRLQEEDDRDLLDFNFNLDKGNVPIFDLIKNFIKNRAIDKDFFDGKTVSMDFSRPPRSQLILTPEGFGVKNSMGSGKLVIKTSDNTVADRLARLYNLYKVSFCKKVANKTALLHSIMSNYSTEE